MTIQQRRQRARVLEALELRSKQFRSGEHLWPFRVPHEPLALDAIVEDASEGAEHPDPASLRSRTIIRLEWESAAWDAWVVTLPWNTMLYCDSDGVESRVLGSVRRGSPEEADRFFLELLAESRGHAFGIELSGEPPRVVRTPIPDRELLADVFVELFEGTDAERAIHIRGAVAPAPPPDGRDFRAEVEQWLDDVLVVTASPRALLKPRRYRRLREVRELT